MPKSIFTLSGSTKKTQYFLREMQTNRRYSGLGRIAQRGVAALAAATPKDSGFTASSWSYEIEVKAEGVSIYWINTHEEPGPGGVNIAIILQYGHGTGTGGYVKGRDYINPALKPIFDEIANDVWKKVTSA